MATEIVQVRDVPSEDVAVLRARAAARQMSLSRYLRELIHEDASRPTMADVLARIADQVPVDATSAEIRAFLDDGRR